MTRYHQFEFDWLTASLNPPEPELSDLVLPPATVGIDELPSPAIGGGPDSAIEARPWDFTRTFPAPLDEAVRAGTLGVNEMLPEDVASLHFEHGSEYLAVLRVLDAVTAAQQSGIDPRTGRPPRTPRSRDPLHHFLDEQAPRLRHALDELLAVYGAAFGNGAAEAFRDHLHERHYDVDAGDHELAPGNTSPSNVVPFPLVPHQVQSRETFIERFVEPRLPCPRPLPEAVERAAFGTHDDGEPVDPSEEEVAEITLHLGERLMDALEALRAAETRLAESGDEQRQSAVMAVDRARCAGQSVLALYEDDFGPEAAKHLDAWARHRVESGGATTGYGRGHPWHYLERGDGQPPVAAHEIPPNLTIGDDPVAKLPRAKNKRRAAILRNLADQQKQLAEERERYTQLVERGPRALSAYDREVAHGGDEELAWATAIALKFSQISTGLGRIARLERELGLGDAKR